MNNRKKKQCSNSLNVRDILIKEIVKYKIDIIKHKTIIGRVINNLFLSNKSLSAAQRSQKARKHLRRT